MRYISLNRKLKCRINNIDVCEYILIVIFLMFSCFTQLISSWIPSGILKYSSVILAITFIIIKKLRCFKFFPRFIGIELYIWFVFAMYALFSNNTFYYNTYGMLVCFASVFAFNFFMLPNIKWIKSFYDIILASLFIHVVITIMSFFNSNFYISFIRPIINGPILSGEGYKAGLNTHYSANSIYLALCTIISFGRYHACKRKSYTIIWAASLTALLLLAKRGVLIAAICSCIAIYLLNNRFGIAKSLGKLCIGFLLITTLILLVSQNIPQLISVTMRFSGNDITNGRIPLYELAWTLYKEKPILGIGWGNYRYHLARHRINVGLLSGTTDVHNVYLQVLCEAGIVGEVLFLILIYSTFFKSLHLHKQNIITGQQTISEHILLSIGVQVFFMIYCNTENPLYDPQVLFPYALSCGVIYSIRYDTLVSKQKELRATKAMRRCSVGSIQKCRKRLAVEDTGSYVLE